MVKRKGNIASKIAKALAKGMVYFSKKFVYLCRFPFVSVPIVGAFIGAVLYYFHGTDIATFFMVTIIAWIASDAVTPFIIRGGNGIFQFKLRHTHYS